MTRSEQIEVQAKSLVEEFAKEQGIDPKEVQGLGMWFKLGCSWADKNPNGSQIKWQTGEPKYSGMYITTLRNGDISYDCWTVDRYGSDNWVKKEQVVAWCKLSDIEPYKEETK